MRAHPGDAGVRRQERLRPVVDRHDVPERALVDVREIDEDAAGVQRPYGIASGGGEARLAAEPERRRRAAVDRIRQMDDRRPHDRVVGDRGDTVRCGRDGVETLDRGQAGVGATRPDLAILAQRTRLAEQAGGARDQRPEPLEVAEEHAPARSRQPEGVGRDRPHRTVEAAVAETRHVDVADEAAPERTTAVTRQHVVARDARQDERVDVHVDDFGRTRELHGFHRHAQPVRERAVVGDGVEAGRHRVRGITGSGARLRARSARASTGDARPNACRMAPPRVQ